MPSPVVVQVTPDIYHRDHFKFTEIGRWRRQVHATLALIHDPKRTQLKEAQEKITLHVETLRVLLPPRFRPKQNSRGIKRDVASQAVAFIDSLVDNIMLMENNLVRAQRRGAPVSQKDAFETLIRLLPGVDSNSRRLETWEIFNLAATYIPTLEETEHLILLKWYSGDTCCAHLSRTRFAWCSEPFKCDLEPMANCDCDQLPADAPRHKIIFEPQTIPETHREQATRSHRPSPVDVHRANAIAEPTPNQPSTAHTLTPWSSLFSGFAGLAITDASIGRPPNPHKRIMHCKVSPSKRMNWSRMWEEKSILARKAWMLHIKRVLKGSYNPRRLAAWRGLRGRRTMNGNSSFLRISQTLSRESEQGSQGLVLLSSVALGLVGRPQAT